MSSVDDEEYGEYEPKCRGGVADEDGEFYAMEIGENCNAHWDLMAVCILHDEILELIESIDRRKDMAEDFKDILIEAKLLRFRYETLIKVEIPKMIAECDDAIRADRIASNGTQDQGG